MFEDKKELSYIEQQAMLYFKLHFKIEDLMEDLKVFVGREYALDVNQVEHYSIYHFVVKLYFKLVKLNIIKVSYEDFVLDLFKYERSIDYIGMIKKLRGLIQNAETNGMLGEPDFSLLPKYEDKKQSSSELYDSYVESCELLHCTIPMEFKSWLELQQN